MEQDKKFEDKLKKLIEELPGVKLLKELGVFNYTLVGGAIYDLVDNILDETLKMKAPKDYDLIGTSEKILYEKDFKHLYSTEYATTFEKNGIRFQILKTDIMDFDFTISTIQYKRYTNGTSFSPVTYTYLSGDFMNLETKNLVPIHSNSFKNRMNQLARLPHYINKGFTIHPLTYDSLIRETYRCGGGQVGEFNPKES